MAVRPAGRLPKTIEGKPDPVGPCGLGEGRLHPLEQGGQGRLLQGPDLQEAGRLLGEGVHRLAALGPLAFTLASSRPSTRARTRQSPSARAKTGWGSRLSPQA